MNEMKAGLESRYIVVLIHPDAWVGMFARNQAFAIRSVLRHAIFLTSIAIQRADQTIYELHSWVYKALWMDQKLLEYQ